MKRCFDVYAALALFAGNAVLSVICSFLDLTGQQW